MILQVRGTLAGKMERVSRDRSKKVAAVEAGLKQAAEKRRKLNSLKRKKISISLPIPPPAPVAPNNAMPSMVENNSIESRGSSLLMNTPSSSSTLQAMKLSLSKSVEDTNASKKPKKGQSTAKQRLGKILKLKF